MLTVHLIIPMEHVSRCMSWYCSTACSSEAQTTSAPHPEVRYLGLAHSESSPLKAPHADPSKVPVQCGQSETLETGKSNELHHRSPAILPFHILHSSAFCILLNIAFFRREILPSFSPSATLDKVLEAKRPTGRDVSANKVEFKGAFRDSSATVHAISSHRALSSGDPIAASEGSRRFSPTSPVLLPDHFTLLGIIVRPLGKAQRYG